MKAKLSTNTAKSFEPKTIEITFESQSELDVFGTLFNSGQVADALGDMAGDSFSDLWEVIEEAGGEVSGEDVERMNDLLRRYLRYDQ